MYVVNGDTILNMDHVAVVRMYQGANALDFYGISVYGGETLLSNYIAPKGYKIQEIFELITEATKKYQVTVELPQKITDVKKSEKMTKKAAREWIKARAAQIEELEKTAADKISERAEKSITERIEEKVTK